MAGDQVAYRRLQDFHVAGELKVNRRDVYIKVRVHVIQVVEDHPCLQPGKRVGVLDAVWHSGAILLRHKTEGLGQMAGERFRRLSADGPGQILDSLMVKEVVDR